MKTTNKNDPNRESLKSDYIAGKHLFKREGYKRKGVVRDRSNLKPVTILQVKFRDNNSGRTQKQPK